MEVPKNLAASVNSKNNVDGSDDDIEVIQSVNNGSAPKFGNSSRPGGMCIF